MNQKLWGMGLLTSLFIFSCSPSSETKNTTYQEKNSSQLYSYLGNEYKVSFPAIYKTKSFKQEDLVPGNYMRDYLVSEVTMTTKYLFGPLTERSLGGMQNDTTVEIDWDHITAKDDELTVPYTYKGTWILAQAAVKDGKLKELPLPYNYRNLQTTEWLKCTDSNPEHQTISFFWYFWDPERYGCDHKVDVEYQMVAVELGEQTVNQVETYPEYAQLIQSAGINNSLKMTFAFGYVNDVADSHPDKDRDSGMAQYRVFIRFMDAEAKTLKLTKTPILQKEYLNPMYPDKMIGYRYLGEKNGVKIEVKVVTSANIDQMDLFAQSYAHDHDGFFGWFGHSRVGSGFDAQNFAYMVQMAPDYYSIAPQYQLVYWAGCNSYSYYTMPFFQQKAALDKTLDPHGTKNLDIIANALPSLFSFNAQNAKIAYQALINWEKPTSYQTIVTSIEKNAKSVYNSTVIVNVLGDEDNK